MSVSKDRKAAPAAEHAADQIKKKYRPEFAQIAKVMCAKGACNEDLAEAFGVNIETIKSWLTEHEDFAEACRESADDRVERALYERAIGYESTERKLVRLGKEIVMVNCPKHVPADVKAAVFLLSKRRPSRYGPKSSNADADDPFMLFLKSINGCVLQPVDDPPEDRAPPRPVTIDATAEDDEPEFPPNSAGDNEA
jgi:hypothetical protein